MRPDDTSIQRVRAVHRKRDLGDLFEFKQEQHGECVRAFNFLKKIRIRVDFGSGERTKNLINPFPKATARTGRPPCSASASPRLRALFNY